MTRFLKIIIIGLFSFLLVFGQAQTIKAQGTFSCEWVKVGSFDRCVVTSKTFNCEGGTTGNYKADPLRCDGAKNAQDCGKLGPFSCISKDEEFTSSTLEKETFPPIPVSNGQGLNFDILQRETGVSFIPGTIGDLVSRALLFIFPVAGLILLLYLLYSGYQFILSRGDPKALQEARNKLTTAIIGFIIVFGAYWIAQAAGLILGLNQIRNLFQ